VFTFSDVELQEGLTTFFNVGNSDYSDLDWTSPLEHGSRLQRTMAFGSGWLGASGTFEEFGNLVNGYPWCFGYQDFSADSYTQVGPYRLINLPGRSVTQIDADTVTIAAQSGTAYTTSELRMYWLPDAGRVEASASPQELAPTIAEAVVSVLPGVEAVVPQIDHLPLSAGEAAGFYFKRALPDGSVESGIVELLSPKVGSGGLLITATRPSPPLRDSDEGWLAVLFEHYAAVSELANRLCGPGESATADPQFGSVACSDDQ
jgi:hypothetical protein